MTAKRPAPAGQLAGDRHVCHGRVLAAFQGSPPTRRVGGGCPHPPVRGRPARHRPPRPHRRTRAIPGPGDGDAASTSNRRTRRSGFGDWSQRTGEESRPILRRRQSYEGANRVAGEPIPITDLHCQRKTGQTRSTPRGSHSTHDRGRTGRQRPSPRWRSSDLTPPCLHRQHVVVVGVERHPRRRCPRAG